MIARRRRRLAALGADTVAVRGRRRADPFDDPAGQGGLVVHLVELVLNRRAAAVDDQDLHAGMVRRSRRGRKPQLFWKP